MAHSVRSLGPRCDVSAESRLRPAMDQWKDLCGRRGRSRLPACALFLFGASASCPLEVLHAIPVLILLALRPTFPLPQCISALAPVPMLCTMPELLSPTLRPPRLLPKPEGALANGLLQALLGQI